MNFVGRQGHGSMGGGVLSRRGLQTWRLVLQALQGFESLQISPQELGGSVQALLHCPHPPPSSPAEMLQSAPAPRSGMKGTVKGQP